MVNSQHTYIHNQYQPKYNKSNNIQLFYRVIQGIFALGNNQNGGLKPSGGPFEVPLEKGESSSAKCDWIVLFYYRFSVNPTSPYANHQANSRF